MDKTKMILLAGAMALLALALILYPLISNAYYERHKAEIHTEYQEQVEQMDSSNLIEAKENAIAYNEVIKPVLENTDGYSIEALEKASQNYEGQLDVTGTGIMGYVNIPKINVNLPIYHGTAADTLEQGIGHLLGSSLPIGGTSTHSVLTAHSGMASQKMFSDLNLLEEGDIFHVEVLDEMLTYEVVTINTVLPENTELLGIVSGEDLCTLVTCTPFGVNSHRLLVCGSRIDYDEEQIEEVIGEEATESTWENQYVNGLVWGVTIVIVIAVIAFLVWLVRRE
ncbi:MAG: class C sortase [Oscillospiraceae bacterium]|nr:class C sortase [Oscillospiraceae bacterium]